jgi:transposase
MDDLDALATASRTDLVALIRQLRVALAEAQATIEQLEAQVAALETRLPAAANRPPGPSGPTGMPGHKPPPRTPTLPPKGRRRRPGGFARRRALFPDAVVTHATPVCPRCATHLAGGWVAQTRQVIELALTPATVTEHQFLARRCPGCRQVATPRPAQVLAGQVVGRQRFGVTLLSLIVSLREAARLPIETIQWYLRTVHGLTLSAGAIVAAQRQVAACGAATVTAIRDQVRASPVVHGDETGWREGGRNGYLWTFSTPTLQYVHFGTRARAEVIRVLGERFGGTLVTDFYAAYNHHEGPHQRCWAHLVRDLTALADQHPGDEAVQRWVRRVKLLFRQAKRFTSPEERARHQARLRFEQKLGRLCQPFLAEPTAVAGTLCRRIAQFLKQLFVFVADPTVPPTNNQAERDVRHQVAIRKISGGTRSAAGTATKVALATLFGTWRRQGLNPFQQCRLLLIGGV